MGRRADHDVEKDRTEVAGSEAERKWDRKVRSVTAHVGSWGCVREGEHYPW